MQISENRALDTAHASRTKFNVREWLILTCAGVLGTIAVLPYAFTLLRPQLEKAKLRIPFPALLALQVAQSAVLFALFVAVGLWFAKRCGLGAPLLERWLAGESIRQHIAPVLRVSIPVGVVSALVIIGLDLWFFTPRLPVLSSLGLPHPPAWQGLLASFYGGIGEELLVRLGIMSLFTWVFGRLFRGSTGAPGGIAFWLGILFAALLFGLGHLPAAAALMPLTKLAVSRVLVLNAIPGVAFGYLYWKRGLESAMAAHFSADLVLHVIMH